MNQQMKSFYIFLLLLLLSARFNFAAAPADSLHSFRDDAFLTFNIGHTYSSLNEAKTSFRGIVENYRSYEVNMPLQTLYPYSWVFGGNFGLRIAPNLYIGLEYYNADTKAFSLYSDKAGSIDVASSIKSYKFGFTGKYEFSWMELLSPFVEFGMGVLSFDYELTEQFTMNPPVNLTSSAKITASGKTIYVNLNIGLTQKLYNFILIEKLGYQIADKSDIDAAEKIDGTLIGTGKLTNDIDLSGFSLEFGIGFRL
jgi:hypothetical protein